MVNKGVRIDAEKGKGHKYPSTSIFYKKAHALTEMH